MTVYYCSVGCIPSEAEESREGRRDDAVKIITQGKKLALLRPIKVDYPAVACCVNMHLSSCSCLTRLRYILVQITSLNTLRDEVSELRAMKYCQEDKTASVKTS